MSGPHPAIDILLDQRNWKQAEPLIRDALRDSPNDARLLGGLALCMINSGRVRESRAVLGAALEADANYAFIHYLCGHAARKGAEPLTRHAFESQGSLTRRYAKKAEPYFREALRLDPDNAGYFESASLNALERRETRQAIAFAQQGLERDPDHPGCLNALSSAMARSGKLNDAQRASLAALAANPDDAYTHANRGWLLLRTGRNEDALTHFRSSLRRHPDSLWARLGLREAIKRRFLPYRLVMSGVSRLLRLSDNRPRLGQAIGKTGGLIAVSIFVVMVGLLVWKVQGVPDYLAIVAGVLVTLLLLTILGVMLLLVLMMTAAGFKNMAEYTLLLSADGRLALTPSERLRMSAWLLVIAWLVLVAVVAVAEPGVWVRAAVLIFGLPTIALLAGLIAAPPASLTRGFWIAVAVGYALAAALVVGGKLAGADRYLDLFYMAVACVLGLPVAAVVAVQRALPEELRDE